ncbi:MULTISPECIES: hypothetical protein [Nonomuraea]|uniref:Uncharacterized protein n=1 Tax=Nonomuraea ferruginea TaxID=46174 RepID=A0ABT4SY46_9ACTN|nr:hypothetical protein [Nonomuraea ferruginea]MDA0642142.1 hypothetical protein [Nonomuraea ferruginea]
MELDYVLAGYRVATRTDRQDWQEAGLPGPSLLSLSDCVVDLVPVDPSGWDHWFASPQEAEIARNQAGNSGLHVLGVGFAAADVRGLQADMADDGCDGSLQERLIRHEQFPGPGERRLGFELVGFDIGNWHTWTCMGDLVTDVHQATGIQPDLNGLIQDEQDARRAAQWLTDSGLGDPKVFLWAAALLTEPPRATLRTEE